MRKRTVNPASLTSIFRKSELLCLGVVFEYSGRLKNQQEFGVNGYSG